MTAADCRVDDPSYDASDMTPLVTQAGQLLCRERLAMFVVLEHAVRAAWIAGHIAAGGRPGDAAVEAHVEAHVFGPAPAELRAARSSMRDVNHIMLWSSAWPSLRAKMHAALQDEDEDGGDAALRAKLEAAEHAAFTALAAPAWCNVDFGGIAFEGCEFVRPTNQVSHNKSMRSDASVGVDPPAPGAAPADASEHDGTVVSVMANVRGEVGAEMVASIASGASSQGVQHTPCQQASQPSAQMPATPAVQGQPAQPMLSSTAAWLDRSRAQLAEFGDRLMKSVGPSPACTGPGTGQSASTAAPGASTSAAQDGTLALGNPGDSSAAQAAVQSNANGSNQDHQLGARARSHCAPSCVGGPSHQPPLLSDDDAGESSKHDPFDHISSAAHAPGAHGISRTGSTATTRSMRMPLSVPERALAWEDEEPATAKHVRQSALGSSLD